VTLLIRFEADLEKINSLNTLLIIRIISYLETSLRVSKAIGFAKQRQNEAEISVRVMKYERLP